MMEVERMALAYFTNKCPGCGKVTTGNGFACSRSEIEGSGGTVGAKTIKTHITCSDCLDPVLVEQGGRFKRYRLEKRLTQREAAELLDVSLVELSKLERGMPTDIFDGHAVEVFSNICVAVATKFK